jgi:hypothetical protein
MVGGTFSHHQVRILTFLTWSGKILFSFSKVTFGLRGASLAGLGQKAGKSLILKCLPE